MGPLTGLEVLEDEIHFGNIVIDEDTTQQITVVNTGPGVVPLAWRFEPEDAEVIVTGPGTVEAGETAKLELRYTPTVGAVLFADLIVTNGVDERVVALRGNGRSCSIAVEPRVVKLPTVFIGEVAQAEVLFKNYSRRDRRYGPAPGSIWSQENCDGPPWFHHLCLSLPGRRDSFVTNAHTLDRASIEPGRALHRPSRPELEIRDVRLLSGPACATINVRLESEARWGDLECNVHELQQLASDGTCRPAPVHCTNRTDRPITITGWSTRWTGTEAEPSHPIDVAPRGTFSIDAEFCTPGVLVIEGDFLEPAGRMELAFGDRR